TWILKRPGQEGDGVVTAGTPARALDVAVALFHLLARLLDARQICRIIYRGEMVSGVEPAVEDVLVALQAVVVRRERLLREEVAAIRMDRGGEKVGLAFLGPLAIPVLGVLEVQGGHGGDRDADADPPAGPPAPFDVRAGPAVPGVEEHGQ